MKRIPQIVGIAVILALSAFAAYRVLAMNFTLQSFVTGESFPSGGMGNQYEGGGMILKGDGDTNSLTVYAASSFSTNVLCTNLSWSATLPGSTVRTNYFWYGDATFFTTNTASTNTLYATNGFYPYATNGAGVVLGSWSKPVELWSDANGNSGTNLSMCLTLVWGGSSSFTNTASIVFAPSVDGVNWDTNTTFTITKSNLTAIDTLTTNITVSHPWLMGKRYLRMNSIALGSNNAASQFYVKRAYLSGWKP